MRLGLFGGTFDPIHLGHLILAESCREALALDRLWLIVTATPPHKRHERTSINDRLEMARIAIAGNAALEVSELEARSEGPHYSYETVERLAAERPDDELFFLIGADSLRDLPTWRHPERLAALATIAVVSRPGAPIDPSALPDLGPSAKPIRIVESPLIDIASTDLRLAVREYRSIRYRVPRGVEAYIHAQGLYRPA